MVKGGRGVLLFAKGGTCRFSVVQCRSEIPETPYGDDNEGGVVRSLVGEHFREGREGWFKAAERVVWKGIGRELV